MLTTSAPPAPGFHDAGNNSASGALWNVGRGGYSWASTIPAGSADVYFLGFTYDWVYPNYSHGRANGLPLRCLQE